MKKLTIVANIIAKKGQVELVKSELIKLIEPTRLEEGCIDYELHQDNENPAHFVFLENWTSRELLQKHLQSEHIAAYSAATEGAVEHFSLNELTHIA